MIIIRYCGGLGNQMFQYAMQIAMTKRYPKKNVKAEIFHYNLENEHNGFELCDVFDLNINLASKTELRKVYNGIIPDEKYAKLPLKVKKFILRKFQNKYLSLMNKIFKNKSKKLVFDDPKNCYVNMVDNLDNGDWYLRGFWQRTDYFEKYRSLLLKDFNLACDLSKEDLDIVDLLKEEKCVAVHIRGGDFINPKYNLCNKNYYDEALKTINSNNLPLIIFTDDIQYAKKMFKGYKIYSIVSHDILSSKIDMYMMSMAKKIIISNSTFSFWGAYLSKINNQSVVCPKYASWDGINYRIFPIRDSWKIIDNSNQ